MPKLVVDINCINGEVKLIGESGDKKCNHELQWCALDEEGCMVGFITSFTQAPIMVTEIAAEQFLRLLVATIIQALGLKRGELTIINHMGERIPDVQFLPPTFDGDESAMQFFITCQEGLVRLFAAYDEQGMLDSGLVQHAEDEGIADDFLNLVHLRGSGIFLALSQTT